jgi:hypothetical protein
MLDGIKKLSLVILTIFAPIKAAIVTVFVLVLFDCVTGILASRKQNIPITSSGLKDSVVKMLVYQVAIIAAFVIETYLSPGIPLTNMTSSYVGLVELLSLNENIEIISGRHLLAGLIAKIKTKQE